MLDPVLLQTFLAVAETRSFTAAGARLGISQPTVSQHVRRLETAVARTLVARDTRGVTLTDNGDAMAGFARTILAATLLGLNWSVGKLSSRSRRFDEMVEGKPVILVRHGHLFRDELARQSLSEHDFAIARRSAGYAALGDIALAVLESSGEITFIRRKERAGGDDA